MQATRALHAGVRRVMRFHSHAQARFVPRGARAMHGSDNTKDRLSLPWMEDDHTMRQPGLAQSDTFAETLLKLSTTFTNHFPTRLSGPRTVGRETEYPIVFDDGRAGDVRKVLHALDAEGDLRLKHEGDVGLYCADYEYSMEVGHGSIEVITGPCETLHELRDLHEDATLRMAAAAQRIGFRVLGLGTQPITAPSRALMSPRRRYIAMLDTALPDEDWLLFTITHADQCHVDVCADELIRAINIGNLLSATVVALCGNSSIVQGQESGYVSAREGLGARIGGAGNRWGMARGPFYSATEYLAFLCRMPILLRPRTLQEMWEGLEVLQPVAPVDGRVYTYKDVLEVAGLDWDTFKVHEKYCWSSARPRTQQRTMEFRAACTQPWEDHMVVPALSLGIMEAAANIVSDDKLHDLHDWKLQRRFHDAAVTHGLRARVDGLDVIGVLTRVLELCHAALKERGHGEEVYLEPLFGRVERRENPGQRAARLCREEGVASVVDAFAIQPQSDAG